MVIRSATRAIPILAALWLAAPSASAQEPAEAPASETEARARELFTEGLGRVDQERWGEAVQLFERSWMLVERPSTAYNLAVARLRLGRPTAALEALDDYLRISDPEAEAERRAEARGLLETALAAVARVTLLVDPPAALVRVDGEVAAGEGSVRELRIDPGDHVIRVEAEGHEPGSLELSVLAGERARREIALTRRPTPTGPARLRITADRPTARVLLDGEEVGLGTYVDELPPGSYAIEVRAEGFVPFRRTVELAPGQQRDVQAALTREDTTDLAQEPAFWVVLVGAAALIGGGVALGVALGSQMDAAYGGNTDVVLQGLTARF